MDDMNVAKLRSFAENSDKSIENLLKQDRLKLLQDGTGAAKNDHLLTKFKENSGKLDFSHIWNGSLSSLMSCDNLTEDLVAETMKELEKALCESQNLLSERDKDILELRKALEDCKLSISSDMDRQDQILTELEKSQKTIMNLRNELTSYKRKEQSEQTKEEKVQKANGLQSINVSDTAYSECTCYCGSVCNALREINEVKRKLEQTEHKYATLKRKIREKRKAETDAHRNSLKMTVNERSPGCVLQ